MGKDTGILVVIVAAAVAVGAWSWMKNKGGPAPPPPPPSGMGQLAISTAPVSGGIMINGLYEGQSPQVVVVTPGTYTVTFTDISGYTTPVTAIVTVAANETVTVVGQYTTGGAGILWDDVFWMHALPMWEKWYIQSVAVAANGTNTPADTMLAIHITNLGAAITSFRFDVRAVAGTVDVLLASHLYMPDVPPGRSPGWDYPIYIPVALPNGTYTIKVICFRADDSSLVSEFLSSATLIKTSV